VYASSRLPARRDDQFHHLLGDQEAVVDHIFHPATVDRDNLVAGRMPISSPGCRIDLLDEGVRLYRPVRADRARPSCSGGSSSGMVIMVANDGGDSLGGIRRVGGDKLNASRLAQPAELVLGVVTSVSFRRRIASSRSYRPRR